MIISGIIVFPDITQGPSFYMSANYSYIYKRRIYFLCCLVSYCGVCVSCR